MACNLLGVHYLRLIKQKSYLFSENLDQLINVNIGFAHALLLLIFIPVNNCEFES